MHKSKTIVSVLPMILLILMISLSISSSMIFSQNDIEQTIMLQKARPAIVLVVTIPHGIIVWEDAAQIFASVGLNPAVYVETAMFGSGFFVSPDGYIITNGHVVNNFESDLQEKLPLLMSLVNTYADAYAKMYGEYPSNTELNNFFMAAINAYVTNKLKIQDYSVDVYVCMGKVVTGLGNIKKCKPARIVDSTPFEKEDLALIKIEVSHAPSLIVSKRDTVNVGETVWVLGYPGAVTFHDLLSSSTQMIPTITRGMVSGYREKTTGISVLQSDVNVNHGNSGGPMIDANGEVIAVTSFGSADPTGSGREVPGFNFFIPSKYIWELLTRNNVNNEQDSIMDLYEDGLRLYYQKHYSAAIEKFKLVQNLNPGFPYIDEYIANAQAAILRGEDIPLETGPNPLVFIAIGIVAATGGVGGLYFYFRKRKAQKQYIVPSIVQQPVPPKQGQQINITSTTGSEAIAPPVVNETTSHAEVAPSNYKFCWNCGRKIPVDEIICPYCGVKQED